MGVESLATSRVLVIDDRPEEALPIITELSRLGVGCVYLRGDRAEELPDPDNPLEDIRLVFLDLHLDEEGDTKTVLSKTVNVLKHCLGKDAMPVIVVCWTRHEHEVDTFRDMAFKAIPDLKPGFFCSMPKPVDSDPGTWKGLLVKVRELLAEHQALDIIWKWEQSVHQSVTATSQTLSEVATGFTLDAKVASSSWGKGMFSVLRELVRADVGKTGNKKTVSNALFRIMNELAVDRLNHALLKDTLPSIEQLIPKGNTGLIPEQVARLNQMILIDPIPTGDKAIRPGNVYVPQKEGSQRCLHTKLGVKAKHIHDSIIHGAPRHSSAEPVVVELSPVCDFVQEKRPVCSFIAGYLLPLEALASDQMGEHLHHIGPFTVPGRNGLLLLVLSKRFQFGLPLKIKDITNRPLFRLRSHVLADLRVKAANYKARPGTTSLDVARKKSEIVDSGTLND